MNYVIYIPNYNGSRYLRTMRIPRGVDVIVMDNCSIDDSKVVAQERNFQFIENRQQRIGRVENWHRCLSHFQTTNYDWMKWLFIGDDLDERVTDTVERAVSLYPDASIIIFDYKMDFGIRAHYKRCKNVPEGYISSSDLSRYVLGQGNIFGAPLGTLVSRKANFDAIEWRKVESLPWVGDLLMCYMMLRDRVGAYMRENIGTFHADRRKTYSKDRRKLTSFIEQSEALKYIYSDALFKMPYEEADKLLRDGMLPLMRGYVENNSKSWREISWIFYSFIRSIVKKVLRVSE